MFCIKCGERLVEGARFCARCGHPVQSVRKKIEVSEDKETYVLTVCRTDQFFAINPAIKIEIDNKEHYEVKNGSSVRIPISAGLHRIVFSLPFESKIIDIHITQDASVVLKLNRLTGEIIVN
ncbi:zinc-ribbon domain-containing protein [Senimuribacter intestinalis]|jgi:hypothetical protein|uniref:zinc-ribbon domain-containing protein n=1 Tax=Senimuribacter intestinalis TaxID=2941507 RepID=UPI00203B7EE6|nr:zinc-ribbon domain-containing protein [Senimuribacter intestinalis]